MTQTKPKATATFTAHTVNHEGLVHNTHVAFGDLNGTLLESIRADYEKALKDGAEIEHTGILGPEGSREIIEWSPDMYLEGEYIRYSETKDGDRVRGTLARKLTHNGEVTIVSSKKTFRVDE
jgi:hypothetical protein